MLDHEGAKSELPTKGSTVRASDACLAMLRTFPGSDGGSYTRTMLTEGSVAPAFTLPDQNGDRVSLSDFRGGWLVLFWFPKAFTSG